MSKIASFEELKALQAEERAKIVVRDGERVIISKKKQKLAPAEMEKVELTKEMLESVSSGNISFGIEF